MLFSDLSNPDAGSGKALDKDKRTGDHFVRSDWRTGGAKHTNHHGRMGAFYKAIAENLDALDVPTKNWGSKAGSPPPS